MKNPFFTLMIISAALHVVPSLADQVQADLKLGWDLNPSKIENPQIGVDLVSGHGSPKNMAFDRKTNNQVFRYQTDKFAARSHFGPQRGLSLALKLPEGFFVIEERIPKIDLSQLGHITAEIDVYSLTSIIAHANGLTGKGEYSAGIDYLKRALNLALDASTSGESDAALAHRILIATWIALGGWAGELKTGDVESFCNNVEEVLNFVERQHALDENQMQLLGTRIADFVEETWTNRSSKWLINGPLSDLAFSLLALAKKSSHDPFRILQLHWQIYLANDDYEVAVKFIEQNYKEFQGNEDYMRSCITEWLTALHGWFAQSGPSNSWSAHFEIFEELFELQLEDGKYGKQLLKRFVDLRPPTQ